MFMHDLIPIVMFVGLFLLIFSLYYIRSRENMAMLEKGLNPRAGESTPKPFISLKFGLLLVGAGLGLFIALMLESFVFAHKNDGIDISPLYPSLIGIGGGLGLIISYFIEKKQMDKKGA